MASLFSSSAWRVLAVALLAVPVLTMPRVVLAADEKEEDDEEEPAAKPAGADDQPKLTSGGLFTKLNYDINEVGRPQNLTQQMIEARLDFDFSLNEGATFDPITLILSGRYGVSDTLEVDAGFAINIGDNNKSKAITVGAQQAIMYDLLAARIDLSIPLDPTTLNIALGLPVKYRLVKDKIAIVALENILTFHTEGDGKPDLTLSVGGIFQVMDALAIIVRATVLLPAFSGDNPVVPVRVDGQYSISNLIDIGVTVALGNLAAKDPLKPFDSRAAGLFARARF